MLSWARRVYERSPQSLRGLAWSLPQPFVFSPHYIQARKKLLRARTKSAEEIKGAQAESLARMLVWAIETVPHYRKRMRKILNSKEIIADPFGALNLFPIVNRDEVSATPSEFVSDKVSARRRYLSTTGGTSGRPLEIWLSDSVWATEWAFVYNLLGQYGVDVADSRISLRGVRRIDQASRIVEDNPVYRETRISPFHLLNSNADLLRDVFLRKRPKILHGYPSAVRELITLLGDDSHSVLSSVKVVLLVSENLPRSEAEYLESASGASVASFYGHSERACFAAWSSERRRWIPDPQYGVTEVQDGCIVATGLINRAMPLIRYDTGDMVVSEAVGRPLEVGEGFQEIEGRWTRDYLVGRSGQRITMTALNTHIPEMRFVRKFQFSQAGAGAATLKLVLGEARERTVVAEAIRQEFENKCQGELSLEAEVVTDIPLSSIGKHALIVRV